MSWFPLFPLRCSILVCFSCLGSCFGFHRCFFSSYYLLFGFLVRSPSIGFVGGFMLGFPLGFSVQVSFVCHAIMEFLLVMPYQEKY